MYVGIKQSALGFWGCDIDEDKLRNANRVRIHKGVWNLWIVAAAPGAEGEIADVVDEWLDPVDTSIFSDPTISITALHNQQQANDTIKSYGGAQFYPDGINTAKFGANPRLYYVAFLAPKDAPVDLPWPLEGCPEDPKWVLSASMFPVSEKAAKVAQESQQAVEDKALAEKVSREYELSDETTKREIDRAKAAMSNKSVPSLPTLNFSSESGGINKTALFIGVGVVGLAGVFFLSQQLKPQPIK